MNDSKRNRFARGYWGERAEHWDKNADMLAGVAERFNVPLMDACGIGPRHRVLDLASGAGEPALSVAKRVGPLGRVVATDLAPEMLEGVKRRAHAAGLANMDFRVTDMETLPFGPAEFDRITCRFGIMFTENPIAAATECRRVLRPGGKAAFMVWGPRADTTQFVVFAAAAKQVFGDTKDLDLDSPFRFGGAGSLSKVLNAGGFAAAEEKELRFTPKMPANAPFWKPHVGMTFGPVLAKASAETRKALDRAIEAEFQKFRHGDELHLNAHVRIGIGTVA